ncbi:hypothetical protein ARMSODRAFT_1024552 [Armillaria solidipes]|uniref:Uncharacterized protein n=1 Tax=Armillaria solidipes TaxID=1076256 RepID=A0A2H3AZ42_9AGAR|nr:hypothetical protein ARMSODRAFT_1024552 [Armillaria solidipes]
MNNTLDAQKATLFPPQKQTTPRLAQSTNAPPSIIHFRIAGHVGEPDEPNTDTERGTGRYEEHLWGAHAEIVAVGLQSGFSTCGGAFGAPTNCIRHRGRRVCVLEMKDLPGIFNSGW